MTVSRRNRILRLTALLAVLAVALLLSGCGITGRKILPGVTEEQLSAGTEPYFDVGGVTYQIQESRQLNPYSDDVTDFTGLKSAQSLPASDFWYGVFLWAKNQSRQTLQPASRFVLTDSAGNSYSPTTLPSVNPFAWTATPLQRDDIDPNPDSIAASGTTGGGLILFKLPYSVYQNRPLTLHIYAQGASKAAGSVDLDF